MKFSVTCFGVGDGWPCVDRNHASFLYRFGKTSVLIDCGEPIDGRLKASGLGYDRMDAILVSHLHADHIGGFFMLTQGCWLEGRRRQLPVYLPSGAIKPLRGMLNAALLYEELVGFKMPLRPLKARRPLTIGKLRITPFRTTHLDRLRSRFARKYPGDFGAYGFLLESEGLRVGHSADLGRPEDLEPLLKRPLDLLVCEMSHFSPKEIFSYLRGREIGRVVFVHLGRTEWKNLAHTRRLAARMLPDVAHTFARDGEGLGAE